MLFDPNIHDKSYTLANPKIVQEWASSSAAFQNSPLAQDYDVLAISHGLVAYSLAMCSHEWAKSPAAQRAEVLKLHREQIAVCLASKSIDWAQSSAAQNIEVLSLFDGCVVFELAQNFPLVWLETPAAYRKEVLSLRADYLPAFFRGLNNDPNEMDPVYLTQALHRFITVGALGNVSIKATQGEFASELDVSTLFFKKEALNDLVTRLDESIALLKSDSHKFDKTVLLARCSLGLHMMTELFPEMAVQLQEKSIAYTHILDGMLNAMNDSDIEQLKKQCTNNSDTVELEVFSKFCLSKEMARTFWASDAPANPGPLEAINVPVSY